MQKKIILSSSSPARQMLLSKLNIPFITCNPKVDETALPNEIPQALVERLSISKAKAKSCQHYPHALIIGCDQIIVSDNQILGKPLTHEKAVKQLSLLSGKKVNSYTGLCLYNSDTQQYQLEVVPFDIVFRELSLATIEAYLKREKPYHCAGSLKAEALGIVLIKRFIGDDPNALTGLPLIKLVDMLRNEGIDILEY